MKTPDTFNLKRLGHLMMNDLRLQTKAILIVAATIAILFVLFSIDYFLILYIGGFIVTSLAFNDLHDRSRAHLFLMLPCSNLERILTKWFLTSIGYAIGTLFIYYLISLLSVVVNLLVFKQQMIPFDVLQPSLWIGIGKYIILQSIILLGAISFKKYALIKTMLVIGCFLFVLGIFSILIAWFFSPYNFQGLFIIQTLLKGGYFIFWIILAPFCWYITYLRLTEYELI